MSQKMPKREKKLQENLKKNTENSSKEREKTRFMSNIKPLLLTLIYANDKGKLVIFDMASVNRNKLTKRKLETLKQTKEKKSLS